MPHFISVGAYLRGCVVLTAGFLVSDGDFGRMLYAQAIPQPSQKQDKLQEERDQLAQDLVEAKKQLGLAEEKVKTFLQTQTDKTRFEEKAKLLQRQLDDALAKGKLDEANRKLKDTEQIVLDQNAMHSARQWTTALTYVVFLLLAAASGGICVALMYKGQDQGIFETTSTGFGGGSTSWKLSRLGVVTLVMLTSVGLLATFTNQVLEATNVRKAAPTTPDKPAAAPSSVGTGDKTEK